MRGRSVVVVAALAVVAAVLVAGTTAYKVGHTYRPHPLLGDAMLRSGRKRIAGVDGAHGTTSKLDALESETLLQDATLPSPIRTWRLQNGLTVLTKEVKEYPTVSVQVWHRVGSHDESPEANGVSHLLEHLLFKGTRNRPVQFMRLLHILGADANAFTNHDVTVYYENAEKDTLYHLLALEADRLGGALINEEAVQSEKDVVISELMGYEGNALYRMNRALMMQAFGNGSAGYGLPVGGLVSDVEALTLEQVQRHYANHYGPANATLVIVGDFDTVEAMKWVAQLFDPHSIFNRPEVPHVMAWYLLVSGAMFPFDPLLAELWREYLLGLWALLFDPNHGGPSAAGLQDLPPGNLVRSNTVQASTPELHVRYHVEDHALEHANQVTERLLDALHRGGDSLEPLQPPPPPADGNATVSDQVTDQVSAQLTSMLAGMALPSDPLTAAAVREHILGHVLRHAADHADAHASNLNGDLQQTDQAQAQELGGEFPSLIQRAANASANAGPLFSLQQQQQQQLQAQLQAQAERTGALDLFLQEAEGRREAVGEQALFVSGPKARPPPPAPSGPFVLSNEPPLVVEEGTGAFALQVLFPLHKLVHRSPYKPFLVVLDEVLSGGHTARLPLHLLDAGVSFSHVSTDAATNMETGWYSITVGVDDEAGLERAQEALGTLLRELHTSDVTVEDLDRAKVNIIAKSLETFGVLEETATTMGRDFVLGGDPYLHDKFDFSIMAVAPLHLRQFCTTFLREGAARVAVLRPARDANSTSTGTSTTPVPEEEPAVAAKAAAGKTPSAPPPKSIADAREVLLIVPDDTALMHQRLAELRWQDAQRLVEFPSPATAAAAMALAGRAVFDHEAVLAGFPGSAALPRRHRSVADDASFGSLLVQSEWTGYLPPEQAMAYLPTLPSLANRPPLPVRVGTAWTLANGLEVRFIRTASKLVHVTGRVLAGANCDPTGRAGLSSLVSQMLMQGTAQYSFADFVYNLENDGSRLTVASGRESLSIDGAALVPSVDRLLVILKEWLANPAFEEGALEMIKASLANAAKRQNKSADDRAMQLLRRAIFPAHHPFHSVPNESSVLSITREDVLRFFDAHVGPQSTKLVVSGDMAEEDVRQLVDSVFGDWKHPSVPGNFSYPPIEYRHGEVAEAVASSADVVSLFGRGAVSRCSESFWVAQVANHILGGDTLSARLGAHVRDDKGLTYGVYSTIDAGIGAGSQVIRMQTAPKKTAEAVASVRTVLRDFADNGVTSVEVMAAKRNLLSRYVLQMASPEAVGAMVTTQALCGRADAERVAERTVEGILGVSAEAVNDYIREHMRPEHFYLVQTGALEA